MPELPLQFRWKVAEGRYRWIESRQWDHSGQPDRPFLTDGLPIGARGVREWSYRPLTTYPGLFRVFAATEPSPDGIRAFADRFGPLGGDLERQILLHVHAEENKATLAVGEARADWNQEIKTMHFAVSLWEAARQGDMAALEQVIFWRADGSGVEVKGPLEKAWIAGGYPNDPQLGRFVPGDLVKPALHHVQSLINQRLKGRASPRLLWNEDRSRLGLYIMPESLIGALWLQFARAVERDSQFRQCAECGIWFELARGTARSDKLYCSTPCRTKAYRKRQAEAVRLHGEGQPLEEIARALDSKPDTVRGWIERHRGPSRSGQDVT